MCISVNHALQFHCAPELLFIYPTVRWSDKDFYFKEIEMPTTISIRPRSVVGITEASSANAVTIRFLIYCVVAGALALGFFTEVPYDPTGGWGYGGY